MVLEVHVLSAAPSAPLIATIPAAVKNPSMARSRSPRGKTATLAVGFCSKNAQLRYLTPVGTNIPVPIYFSYGRFLGKLDFEHLKMEVGKSDIDKQKTKEKMGSVKKSMKKP